MLLDECGEPNNLTCRGDCQNSGCMCVEYLKPTDGHKCDYCKCKCVITRDGKTNLLV